MNGVGRPDTIAQRVKPCAQGRERSAAITRVEFCHHEPQPMVGFLQRRIEHLKACLAHRLSS
jgi:hypothetical protein